MIVCCKINVPVIVGIQQGSVVVMTDDDSAGNVKNSRAIWDLQFGSNVLLKTSGIPCTRFQKKKKFG